MKQVKEISVYDGFTIGTLATSTTKPISPSTRNLLLLVYYYVYNKELRSLFMFESAFFKTYLGGNHSVTELQAL